MNVNSFSKQKRNRLLFYISLVGLPSLQFLIFYIVVNFNSIILAFQEYNVDTASFTFHGFENFKSAIENFKTQTFLTAAVENSITLYLFTLLVGIPLAIVFSYYIYKKNFFHGGFKVVLFIPKIVSSVVLVIIFTYVVEEAYPELYNLITGEKTKGLLANKDTRFGTILFYTLWASFGTQILMYTGAMSGISESIIEAGQIDGIKPIQELIFIVVPMIYNTISTFIIVGVAALFTNQMNLYSFYGGSAEYKLYTLGYYMFSSAQKATSVELPYLSAFGLVLTLIAAPISLLVRYGLNKLGEKL